MGSGLRQARKLLPHALAGGWIEDERHDDVAMLALLAGTSDEEVVRTSKALTRGEDAPLVRIGNVTMTVSQLDALFAVGPHATAHDEVVAALLPICLDISNGDADRVAKLATLRAASAFRRREAVMEVGWATFPGSDEPDREPAQACAAALDLEAS